MKVQRNNTAARTLPVTNILCMLLKSFADLRLPPQLDAHVNGNTQTRHGKSAFRAFKVLKWGDFNLTKVNYAGSNAGERSNLLSQLNMVDSAKSRF